MVTDPIVHTGMISHNLNLVNMIKNCKNYSSAPLVFLEFAPSLCSASKIYSEILNPGLGISIEIIRSVGGRVVHMLEGT